MPPATHLKSRGRNLRHHATRRNVGAEVSVALIEDESVVGEQALSLTLRKADDLWNRCLATVNRQAHCGKERRQKDYDQDQRSQNEAEEAAHQ
jgi:hypothetical protein